MVVAPDCGPCSDPRLPPAWSRIVEKVRTDPIRRGAQITLTGISVSSTVESGLNFLERFGSFHEVISGRGWDNLGVMKFASGDMAGPHSVPQVVIYEREILENPHSSSVIFRDERVLQRHIGSDAIKRWAGWVRIEGLGGASPQF